MKTIERTILFIKESKKIIERELYRGERESKNLVREREKMRECVGVGDFAGPKAYRIRN